VVSIEGYETAHNDVRTSISFPMHLATAPTVDQVAFGTTDSHCSGTTGSPTAAPGYLCIYIRVTSNEEPITGEDPFYPQDVQNLNFGASTFGVLLTARAIATGNVAVDGAWAVTAP